MKKAYGSIVAFMVMTALSWAKPMVAVSIPPQKFLVDEIGGGMWACLVVVDSGRDPHVFEPTPRQLAALRTCDVYFKMGLPFETILVDKLLKTNPKMRVVSLADHEEQEPQDAPDEGEHHEDPHSWMSPDELIAQSQVVATELSKLDSEHLKDYSERQKVFAARVTDLKRELSGKLENAGVKFVAVYHPAWGYFAESFGLEQVAVEAHGQAPGARHLSEVADKLRQNGVKIMLVQNEAERMRITGFAEKRGLRLMLVNPLAENPLETIRKTAAALCDLSNVNEIR